MNINDSLIKQLQKRKIIAQITNEKILEKIIKKNPINVYCGLDPTADSLHLGHLVPLLCLKRFQQAGHNPIVLLGGATGLIGDPSFKNLERKFNTKEIVQEWIYKIKKQVALFLDFNCGINSAITINNYDWFSKMNILTFLREIGKHFSVNQMINKEAVRRRLNKFDQGISFTEFSYSLLQGYDFAYLNKIYGVILQIGGSDQWSNILSGINLTYRLYKNQVFGMTTPLITRDNGNKLGKTEKNTIWLDPNKTSPYKFYQFWLNISDNDIYKYLKIFTFINIEEINFLEKENNNNIKKYLGMKTLLAEKMTRLSHGEEGFLAAKRITKSLFTEFINNLNETDFKQLAQDGVPMIRIKNGASLIQVLIESNLQPSRNQARKVIASSAITINGKKQTNPEYIFLDSDRLFNKYTLLRHGKKNYCLIYWK